jgi:hypothetical protein
LPRAAPRRPDLGAPGRQLERHPARLSATVEEAVLHVLEHFAQHTGQILFATKARPGSGLGYYAHLDQPAPPVGRDGGTVP